MSDCEAGFIGRNLILAVFVGAIVGAGAALLLARRAPVLDISRRRAHSRRNPETRR